MTRTLHRILRASLVAGLALGLAACGGRSKTITVVCADALHKSFDTMAHEYKRQHPDVDVIVIAQGSVLATRLAIFRQSDVLAVADYRLVEKMLNRKQAAWVAKFATTDIVIGCTTMSKRRAEINADNWFDVLLDPAIRYGYADPAQDPCGYYARFAWKLAEDHYFASRGQSRPLAKELEDHCPPEYIRMDALKLISEALTTGIVDYAFIYRVHAVDQSLPFIPLPREVNLGDRSLAPHYAASHILIPDFRGGKELLPGSYIAFGITLLNDARNPEGGRDFIQFVLSEAGQEILGRSGFQPIRPALVPRWGAVPEFLGDLAKPEE